MATYEPNVVLANQTYEVVGTRPVRHDGHDKVTGRARFGADFYATDLLFGKLLRSPHAHALIRSIRTDRAEALPGVRAVVTAADLPGTGAAMTADYDGDAVDLDYMRRNVLARDKVLYAGHAVAGVAATSPHVAEEALALIEVDYAPLPALLTAPEAMAVGAPILLDNLRTDEAGRRGTLPTNVAAHLQLVLGNAEEGFRRADVVVERSSSTRTVHQGYIEPQNVTALWNTDGRIQVWTSTQGAFEVRDTVAAALAVPVSRVTVTPMEVGGGFGGKFPLYDEPVAALLSRKTGRPVRMVMGRREVFEGTGPTSGSFITVKMGATRDGRILAAQASLAYEAGAFPGSPVGAAAGCIFAAYNVPNVQIDGYDVVVNKPRTGAYRAPGATNAAFAAETVVDELAERLGMDPIEFRLLNAAREGTRRANGTSYQRIGLVETLEAMRDHPHWRAPLEGPDQGRGVAVGYWMNGGSESSCVIAVNADGTVNLVEGSPDLSGSRVSLAMQAAEVLGLRAVDVRPVVVDTDSIGYTSGTGGSRVTFATGWAAYEAARDVRRQMEARAAAVWGIAPDSVELAAGVFRSKADPELAMSFKELAGRLNDTGGPVAGRATVSPTGVGGAFAGCIVDVHVDRETGKVGVLRLTVVQDAGKAVHPSYVEGQMQGGCVQGLGWALNEEYFYDDAGRMANTSLLDYRMPTALDVPMIDTVIVEVANPGHPYGVRGVGEVSIVAPPAAIAGAIYRATGARVYRLPMNPVAVLEAIRADR